MRQMELRHPSPREVWVPGARVYDREGGGERQGEGEKQGEGKGWGADCNLTPLEGGTQRHNSTLVLAGRCWLRAWTVHL